jgi:hypothetical protein
MLLCMVGVFAAEGGSSINVHRLLVRPLQGPQTAPKHEIRLSCRMARFYYHQPCVQLGANQAASLHEVAHWHVVGSPTKGFGHAVPDLGVKSVLLTPM